MQSYCKTCLLSLALLFVGIMAGCSSGGGGSAGGDSTTNTVTTATITSTRAPGIVVKSTDGSSCGVDTGAAISVTFSEDILATSTTNTTFTIDGVTGTVAYDSSTRTATFTPSSALASSSSYTATITTGVKNSAGTAMANNYTWSFTTKDSPAADIHLLGGAIEGNPLRLNINAVTTLAGLAGSPGSTDGTGTAARFYWPNGITTDGTNLYVVESGSTSNDGGAIRKIVISTGAVTTLAGSAGSQGSTDGTGTAARFYIPVGITTDGTNLYVVDGHNHTIRKIVISTGVVTTLAGLAGSSGWTDGTGTTARFYYPGGITTDGTNLYVADTSNLTIRKIVISTGAVTTLAGRRGTQGSTDGSGTVATFYHLNDITTDGTNLYVADGRNTIRQISPQTAAPSAPTGVIANAGYGQAIISWDSVPGADCYTIYCDDGNSVTTTTGTETASIASPYVYRGLTNGNTYSCIVTANNPNGEGPPSNPTTFTPAETYLLQVGTSSSSTGRGTITSSPSGIDCGSTCMATVASGATVTLTATPASGSIFAGWSNACSGGTCVVLMDANKMATAAFMSSGGGGGSTCSSWYTQFNSCNQGNYAGGIVPASCICPANTNECGVDNVTAGGPYKMCCCN